MIWDNPRAAAQLRGRRGRPERQRVSSENKKETSARWRKELGIDTEAWRMKERRKSARERGKVQK